jgi:hypothetical protein
MGYAHRNVNERDYFFLDLIVSIVIGTKGDAKRSIGKKNRLDHEFGSGHPSEAKRLSFSMKILHVMAENQPTNGQRKSFSDR